MKFIDKIVKPPIRNLVRIKDTMDDRFDYLRLDKNERLTPFNDYLFEDFLKNVKQEHLSGYGEVGQSYKLLAKYLGLENENYLLLAAGSDIAIKSVFETCIGKGDTIILHAPSYAMYRVYSKMFDASAEVVDMKADWQIDFETMLSKVNSRTKLMVIENPNGFLGTKSAFDQIKTCIEYLGKKDVLLLIDEAYIYVEMEHSSTIEFVKEFQNVVISQTFSKAHGLAGLRVGYLISNPTLMKFLNRVRPMHEITSFATYSLNWILTNSTLLREFQVSIKESKTYLKAELEKLKIAYKDTHANFILMYLPNEGSTAGIAQKLKSKGILIRRPFKESFLKDWTRVGLGTRQDSQKFIKVLKLFLNHE